jgi:1,6-anhydro-N-acetylmuramate kinase
MDGVDAVAVQIEGKGLDMSADYLSMASSELGTIQKTLRQLASCGGAQEEQDRAAIEVGRVTNETILALELIHIDLIALHGQTIFHAPPQSIQLIDATQIVTTFQCVVLTEPRQQDLQLGGQGAPITPLADWIMFRNEHESTAIVNLGGFCNVTILPAQSRPQDVQGFDVCCCNLMLNAISQHAFGIEYDTDGKLALSGKEDMNVTALLVEKLQEQCNESRSLGTNDDLGSFAIQLGKSLRPADLLASATSAIGTCISIATKGVDRVLIAGGGVHNQSLTKAIRNNGTIEQLGVPTQAREAMAMAILGALACDGVSITLPQITGRNVTDTIVGWIQASP